MKKQLIHKILLLSLCYLFSASAMGQGILRGIGNRIPGMSGGGAGGGGGDSLVIRNKNEDSITISYYYLDLHRAQKLDSSINDFERFPIPPTYAYLGNLGVAAHSLLFAPNLTAGFDPGFHSLDLYKFKIDQVRFFNTTRPYTELGYVLGSKAEQTIEIQHTQNIKPSWNFSLDYRLIGAPGYFRNQKTNHNNYLFTSWYQAPSKRYNNYLVLLGNNLKATENGGVDSGVNFKSPVFSTDPYTIPTKIGGNPIYTTNFFSKTLFAGHKTTEFTLLLRQQYDFGRKDSIVTDTTVIPLFYPKLRFEHTFNYTRSSYSYRDIYGVTQNGYTNVPDSEYYAKYYNIQLHQPDTLLINDSLYRKDSWNEISNDFSIYQFPDSKNLQQFIKLGAELQLLKGRFDTTYHPQYATFRSYYNTIIHGEYRNRSKNLKWDILASGRFYLTGYNSGNYQINGSLKRLISPTIGSLQLGFENINRSPSYIYDHSSAFYLDDKGKTFNNEQVLHFFANAFQPKYKVQVSADYYLIRNYLYITDFYKLQQESTLFNVLRVNATKTIRLGRRWNWYAELSLQQKTGAAQLHIPTVFTRNRIMYEGSLGFKKLNIAFGGEMRYHTPYQADNYSPLLGQFFYQSAVTIRNLPDVNAFLYLRIRGFKAFVRAENLNTVSLSNGFAFNNYNLAAPDYPNPGFLLRFGIYWSFVN